MSTDPYTLPPDLPVPVDDGAADHLTGLELPDLALESSQGLVNVRDLDVLYVFPRSGRPGVPLLPGWDETPGARGCTPQSCGFRDAHGEEYRCDFDEKSWASYAQGQRYAGQQRPLVGSLDCRSLRGSR